MNAKPMYLFRVSGIPADVIDEMRHLSDNELKKRRAVRRIVDARPGFPCRVTLEDAEWIRKVSRERRIVVSERGVPVATLIPFEPAHKATPFANRKAVRGFEELPAIEHDSTEYISSDRDRA